MPLPSLPRHVIEVLGERAIGQGGFMWLRRVELRLRYESGAASAPFPYDVVGRTRLDATVIAAHYAGADGERFVFLRSAVRPPAFLRPEEARPVPEKDTLGALWELPAGLVEPDERSQDGLARSAARELLEEIGIEAAPGALRPLGPPTFPAPGIVGERHFYFEVEVDPLCAVVPAEDGSALEREARVVAIPLAEAIELTRRGEIEDAKTEIALRRLAELGARGPA